MLSTQWRKQEKDERSTAELKKTKQRDPEKESACVCYLLIAAHNKVSGQMLQPCFRPSGLRLA